MTMCYSKNIDTFCDINRACLTLVIVLSAISNVIFVIDSTMFKLLDVIAKSIAKLATSMAVDDKLSAKSVIFITSTAFTNSIGVSVEFNTDFNEVFMQVPSLMPLSNIILRTASVRINSSGHNFHIFVNHSLLDFEPLDDEDEEDIITMSSIYSDSGGGAIPRSKLANSLV
uniref:Uncharacterized protein n=1 Tax=Schizaphis graminum TaxID=13262 RepID=A0A2S2N8C2_SCHGA